MWGMELKPEKTPMSRLPLVVRTAVCVVLSIIAAATAAESGEWIKDPARFHASAHGTMTCLDCHSDIPDRERHPDPAAIGGGKDRTKVSTSCLDCHSNVPDDMDQKKHGRLQVEDTQLFQACADCHDPHVTPPLGEAVRDANRPEPAGPIRCDGCHEARESLPSPDEENAPCFSCHLAEQETGLCLSCHGNPAFSKEGVIILTEGQKDLGPHENVGCLSCHDGAASTPHLNQHLRSCLDCHTPHLNNAGGEPHFGVACQACHFEGVRPVALKHNDMVGADLERTDSMIASIHRLTDQTDEETCRRCHFSGNAFGASARVLPAKSITCLPCHVATFGVHDWFSAIGLLLFLLGMAGAVSFWWSAGGRRRLAREPGSRRTGTAIKAFILDGLLQARLWKRSRSRWAVHALIFLPFLMRFLFSIAAMALTRFFPESTIGWAMADKNHPATALFFDLTGLMVLIGAFLAIRYRLSRNRLPISKDLPPTDWPAMALLGAIMLTGFVVEALRILMTGVPANAEFAFVGAALASILPQGPWAQTAHGWAWYTHAALIAAFLAYLPFSRMIHILTAPMTLAWRAWVGDGHLHTKARNDR